MTTRLKRSFAVALLVALVLPGVSFAKRMRRTQRVIRGPVR